jgi:hypothetical protein
MDWSGANGIIAVDLKGKKGGSLNRIPFTSHRDGWCKFGSKPRLTAQRKAKNREFYLTA